MPSPADSSTPSSPLPSTSTFAGKLDLHAFESPSLSSHQDKGKSPVRNHHVTAADAAAAAATAPLVPAYSSPTTRAMKRRLMNDELQPPMHDNLLVTPSQQQQQPKAPRLSRKAAEVTSALTGLGRAPRRAAAATDKLPPAQPTTSNFRDTISPDMILLFVGVNPGIQTGLTGHSYAHPSNLYWKLLHQSGITVHQHPPRDTYVLPELYNIGNTNLVVRPTRDASSLTRAEMDEGARLVQEKIAAARPEAVCFVGKGVWEAVWRVNHGAHIKKEEFRYGWQDERENIGIDPAEGWDGSRVFVATTTSGLAAGMTPAEKLDVWLELGKWVKARRRDRMPLGTAGSAPLVD